MRATREGTETMATTNQQAAKLPGGHVALPTSPATGASSATTKGDAEFAGERAAAPAVSTTVLGDGGVAGNLVADPVIRFSHRGKIMVKLRVASSKRVRDAESGQWREGPTVFHDVVCWGQLAQNVGEHFLKGDLVVVLGVWQREQWTGADGQPNQRVTMAARHIGLGVTFRAARYVRTIIEE